MKMDYIYLFDNKINKYELCSRASKEARETAKNFKYPILDSEMLNWVVYNKHPDVTSFVEAEHRRKFNRPEDILNYISDQYIVKSINRSLAETKKYNKVQYVYHPNIDKYDKSRVRIIVNLLWEAVKNDKNIKDRSRK